jgi:hypothetical protein
MEQFEIIYGEAIVTGLKFYFAEIYDPNKDYSTPQLKIFHPLTIDTIVKDETGRFHLRHREKLIDS